MLTYSGQVVNYCEHCGNKLQRLEQYGKVWAVCPKRYRLWGLFMFLEHSLFYLEDIPVQYDKATGERTN